MKKRLTNKILQIVASNRYSVKLIMWAYHSTLVKKYAKQIYGITNIRIQRGYIILGDGPKRQVNFDTPWFIIERDRSKPTSSINSRYSKVKIDTDNYRLVKFGDLTKIYGDK